MPGDFIEDDDGMGYVDVGEEDYWEADREDADADAQRDEPAEKGKKRKKVDKDAKGEVYIARCPVDDCAAAPGMHQILSGLSSTDLYI